MIISPDYYLTDTSTGEYRWTPSGVKAAWAKAKARYKAVLGWPVKPEKVVLLMGVPASGKSTWLAENANDRNLYFDATFDLPWKRKPYIDMARSAGVPVEVVWLDTPLEVCIERNALRSEDRRVPEDVVRAMRSKIMSSPPSGSEGAGITRVPFDPVPTGHITPKDIR